MRKRVAKPETLRVETFSVRTFDEVMLAVRTFAFDKKALEETLRNVTLAWVLTFRDVTLTVGALTLPEAVRTVTEATF
jgi:hypothetical protein